MKARLWNINKGTEGAELGIALCNRSPVYLKNGYLSDPIEIVLEKTIENGIGYKTKEDELIFYMGDFFGEKFPHMNEFKEDMQGMLCEVVIDL